MPAGLSRAQLLEGIWDVAGAFVSDNTLTTLSGSGRRLKTILNPPGLFKLYAV